jgi:myo-inositol 2-dehydrogenase/D-chiro-inositol 1-dehydrogenase
VVGESGNARLADGGDIVLTSESGRRTAVPADWRERFAGAYDTEFRFWIDDIAEGREAGGPSSWDGYAAAVVADACVTALHSASTDGGGGWTPVPLPERPDFYRI